MLNPASNDSTYLSIEWLAKKYELPISYLVHLIEELDTDTSKLLNVKKLVGQYHLNGLGQRYILTHIDRSAASLFPDADVVPMPSTYQAPVAKVTHSRTLHVQPSAHGYELIETLGSKTTVLGTFGTADAADRAMDEALNRGNDNVH